MLMQNTLKVQIEKVNLTTIIQYIKFILFAGIAAIFNLGSRYIISNKLHLNLIISVVIAYLLGMVINFLLNKNYNFPKSGRKYSDEFITFLIIAAIGLLLTSILTITLFKLSGDLFEINIRSRENLSHLFAVAIVSIYSFIFHKTLTFNKGIRQGIKKYFKKK